MSIDQIITDNTLPVQQNLPRQSNLGEDDFMTLMLTQMQYQDPMNPMDNAAMLSQLAQFSSLEQMENLNNSVVSGNNSQAFVDASNLLGKEVQVRVATSPYTYEVVTSKVVSIKNTIEGPVFSLENEMSGTLADIISVTQPSTTE